MENFKKYLSVRDLAKSFGVTEEWIRDLLQAKKIMATKIGRWRVKPKERGKFSDPTFAKRFGSWLKALERLVFKEQKINT